MVHPLLPDSYQEGSLVARTTSYQRTIATLQGVLSGLFPGTRAPIKVHTSSEIDEILCEPSLCLDAMLPVLGNAAARSCARLLLDDALMHPLHVPTLCPTPAPQTPTSRAARSCTRC